MPLYGNILFVFGIYIHVYLLRYLNEKIGAYVEM